MGFCGEKSDAPTMRLYTFGENLRRVVESLALFRRLCARARLSIRRLARRECSHKAHGPAITVLAYATLSLEPPAGRARLC